MNRYVKMMYSILGIAFLCIISPALANTACNGFDMFDMKCCIEQGTSKPQDLQANSNILYYVQSGIIYQKTVSGDVQMDSASERFRYFQMLFQRRSYQNLRSVEDLYIGDTKYTVALGQKCNHPEVRINGKEYKNDIGIFDVKADSQYLRLYYYEFGTLNAVRCAPQSAYQPPTSVTTTDTQPTIADTIPSPQIISSIETSFPIQPSTENQYPLLSIEIKDYQQLQQSTLYDLVKQLGMDRKTDRKALAEQAGIDPETYRGTKAQNLIIKDYLLHKISVDIQATKTPNIALPLERFERVQKIELRRIVGLRGYVRKDDRMNIAKEYGYQPQIYFGTRDQNLKIRSRLLDKISIKK